MALTFMPLRPSHLAQAAQLSAAAGWPHRIEDWQLVLSISKGFAALAEKKLVATALATPFGSVGMANLIIVDASMRGRGVGRKIMQRAMETIAPATWQLVATPDGLPLYEKLGFSITGAISQHQGMVSSVASIGDAVWAGPEDLPAIIRMDSMTLQMDRTTLYKALSSRARFAVLRGTSGITGFAMVHAFGSGKVIGPVIARGVNEAKSLIALIMCEHTDQFLRVDTATDSGLGPWLTQFGLIKTGSGQVMRTGETIATPGTSPRYFALASQALG